MAFILLSRPIEQNRRPLLAVGESIPETPVLPTDALQLVALLRHVGCPFAEQMVKRLRQWSKDNSETTVSIVSHGDKETTESWIATIGGLGQLHLVVDSERSLHSQWGVGLSSIGHFMHPRPLINVVKLWFKGIRNRRASGTRWQPSAVFLIKDKQVVWRHLARSAEELTLPPKELVSCAIKKIT